MQFWEVTLLALHSIQKNSEKTIDFSLRDNHTHPMQPLSYTHYFFTVMHTSCKILLNFCTYDLMEITSCISCKLTGSLLLFPPHWLHMVTDFWKKGEQNLYNVSRYIIMYIGIKNHFWFDICGFWLTFMWYFVYIYFRFLLLE